MRRMVCSLSAERAHQRARVAMGKTRAGCGHMRASYSAYASTKGRRRASEGVGRDGLSERGGGNGFEPIKENYSNR